MLKRATVLLFRAIFCLLVCCVFVGQSNAQDTSVTVVSPASVAVKNIAVVDLDGILRAADANNRVRKLLDGQRSKFQEQFRAVEIDLQQSEINLVGKRDSITKEEYDKLVNAFQVRVSKVQKEIQYKRQSIDSAYQKALGDIRSLAIEEITAVANERKIELMLNKASTVIFLPKLNISDEVLKRLNERTKNARIELELKKPVME